MTYPGASKLTITNARTAKITVARAKAYYSRGGTKVLEPDVRSVSVTFTTPLKDANWVFGSMTFWNTGDAAVDVVQLAAMGVSAKSQNGFTILLNAAPPTDNYRLDWTIAEAYNP